MSNSHIDLDLDFLFHLANPDSFSSILDEGLAPETIVDSLVRKVFEWQTNYVRQNSRPAPALVLEEQFSEENISIEEPVTDITDLIDRVKRRYGRNEGQKAIRSAGERLIEDPKRAGVEMIEAGQDLVRKLSSHKEIFSESDADKAILRYHKRAIRGRGPSLGFREIDDYFHGLEALTFLVGAPKVAKSWFTIKSALENVKNGQKVVLFPLELPAEITDARLRCMACGIPFRKYLHAEFDDKDVKAFKQTGEELEAQGSYIIEKPPSGQRGVHSLYQRAKDMGADVLYIDQLQYVENDRGRSLGATNDTKDYFEAVDKFKDLADDGIPIWVVHQFNRGWINNVDKFPDMTQIKGSASIEEGGTLVLGLYSNKEMRTNNIIQIGTLATRNHQPAIWDINVDLTRGCSLKMIGRYLEE